MMQTVAKLHDIPLDRGLEVEAGDEKILLVRDGEAVRALAAKCPHAGASLAEGAVCDGRIVCPWHKAMFRVSDGGLLEAPALEGLARYEVRIDGDDVLVGARMAAAVPAAAADDRRVVVIGGGAAGAAAVAALREFGFGGDIALVGREPRPPYDRTALSKFVMSGDMPADDAPALLPEGFFSGQRVTRIEAEIVALDPAAKRIALGDGTSRGYDVAIIATGAAAKRPDLPGIGLEGVHTLREAADAAAIVAGLDEGARAVILGGSFIGLEVASGLRERGLSVAVVTPEPVPFVKQMGEQLGAMFKALHERHGVVFHAGTQARAIEGDGRVRRVVLEDGSAVPADLVIVGVGVAPQTGFARGLRREEDGGIVVDAGMRAGADVYAVGDVARFPFGGAASVRIEHWRVAQQHARVAARNIVGGDAAYDGVPFFWTYHFGKRFEYLGHPHEWDAVVIDGDLDQQRFVALMVKQGEIVGVVACDREQATARLIVRMRNPLSPSSTRESF